MAETNELGQASQSGKGGDFGCKEIPPDLRKILEEHYAWLKTGQGRRADLSGKNLEGYNLAGCNLKKVIFRRAQLRNANLQQAHLEEADLGEADLTGALLQGADLKEANLKGANLSGRETKLTDADFENADLSQTNLQKVDLSPAKNLLVRRLAGADLTGAEVPDPVKEFLEKPGNLDEVARIASTLFVTMLSVCGYIWLTVLSTTDAGLLTNMATSKLPIFSVDIPIAWFYWLAPPLLLAMYVYFHLTLQSLWASLAALPAFFPDGRRLDQISYPWLLNSLVGAYIPRLKEQKQAVFSRFQLRTSVFFAWWFVPITISIMWFRYLTRHEWWPGTIIHLLLLAGALWFCFTSRQIAETTLQGRVAGRREYFHPVNLAVCMVFLTLFSLGTIEGVTPDQDAEESRISPATRELIADPDAWLMTKIWRLLTDPELEGMRRITPLLLNWIHYNPFADLSNAEVSLKPAKWTGETAQEGLAKDKDGRDQRLSPSPSLRKVEDGKLRPLPLEEIAQVKGAPLHGKDLRYANGKRAFLIKAELQNKKGPDFEGAKLQGAYLFEADLRKANLERVILDRALLNNALLWGATLRNARFHDANLAEADLQEAKLQGTDFRNANLRGAVFSEARVHGARFSGAFLQKADFRKAVGLEPDQLKEGRLWALAYYDEGLAKELGLPSDHNPRLAARDLSSYDFRRLNLEKADLARMNLKWSKFQGANLAEADLTGANLQQANLKGAYLLGTQLRETDLQEAVGLYAETVRAGKTWILAKYDAHLRRDLGLPPDHNDRVEKKDLQGRWLKDLDLTGADLSEINLKNAKLNGSTLCQANFQGANLFQADFTRAKLKGANFSRANLQGAIFTNNHDLMAKEVKKAKFWRFARFDARLCHELGLPSDHNDRLKEKDFQGINLAQEDLAGVDFSDTREQEGHQQAWKLNHADLRSANLTGANLAGANLKGAQLKGATLVWANLARADLSEVNKDDKENLKAREVQGAKNWFLAKYDLGMIEKLEFVPPSMLQLHNERLGGKDLSGYNFKRKYLFKGDFSPANLTGTDFQEAYLFQADFSYAMLQRACLRNAFLGGATFSQADMHEVNLEGANVRGADFQGSQRLDPAEIKKAKNWVLARYDAPLRKDLGLPDDHNDRVKQKNLSGASYNFQRKGLAGSDFSGVELRQVKFNLANLKKVDFSGANLEKAELTGAHCQEANFAGAILRGAHLMGTSLENAYLHGADLKGADLREAKLQNADLRGADLRDVIGLSQAQIISAIIDDRTQIPSELQMAPSITTEKMQKR
jgi:uncharacterized protein YjbI with pentapeptide repeats